MTPRNLPSPALAAMWQEDIHHGIDPTGDLLNRPAPRPVETVQPIVPPEFPAPDWRAEQVAAQRSASSATTEPEPDELAPPTAEALQARPARRRRRQWKGPQR